MKFSTTTKNLQDAVSKVIQAVPSKSLDSRFDNIHLILDNELLIMYATDGELSITVRCQVSSTDKCMVGIKARTIQEFLRSMYDTTVNFEIERQQISDQGTVHIVTDKGRYKMLCIFEGKPDVRDKDFDAVIGLNSSELQDLIHKTLFACSVDGMRPAMMGVLFELEGNHVTAVSTDGHRLVRCKKATSYESIEKKKIVVPSRVLSIMQKLVQDGEVKMSVDADRRYVRFISDNVELESALIVEPYPNYEAVIPVENEKMIVVDRSQIHDSVKRVGRFSNVFDIKILLEDQIMKIWAENTEGESAYEEIPCDFNGQKLTIGFNSKFIEAALAHIDTDKVTIEFTSPTTAVIFKPEDDVKKDDYIILVMPVRLNN